MWFSTTALSLILHIGGVPTKADFQNPADVGEIVDASFALRWTDGDLDPTGLFHFFYQSDNAPGNSFSGTGWYQGAPVIDPALLHTHSATIVRLHIRVSLYPYIR